MSNQLVVSTDRSYSTINLVRMFPRLSEPAAASLPIPRTRLRGIGQCLAIPGRVPS